MGLNGPPTMDASGRIDSQQGPTFGVGGELKPSLHGQRRERDSAPT